MSFDFFMFVLKRFFANTTVCFDAFAQKMLLNGRRRCHHSGWST